MTLLPAILAKYDELTMTGGFSPAEVPVYHDRAPQVVSVQLRLPYTIVSLMTGENTLTFESDGVEASRLTFRIYSTSEANLDLYIGRVRFNGGPVQSGYGFDNGTLPNLTDGVLLTIILSKTPTKSFDGIDRDGNNVYRADLEYAVEIQRS